MNQTTVVNVRKESYDVFIGRGSKWGNPFVMLNNSESERNQVCDSYEDWFWKGILILSIDELIGKRIGCFCKPKRCHGDFLALIANTITNDELMALRDIKYNKHMSVDNRRQLLEIFKREYKAKIDLIRGGD